MSNDFYTQAILPYAGIIIKLCRAYTNTEEDFEDYYQEIADIIGTNPNNIGVRISRIYNFDMKLAYGYEMSKLEEIIEDMEELRK